MNRFCFGFFVSFIAAHMASAADERGNGGDAVVCRDGSGEIMSAETLDHYEARIELGIEIHAGFPAGSIAEAVQNVLERIPDFDQTRKASYQSWAETFEEEANFLEGIDLEDIPDSHHVIMPSGCEVEQLVVQRQSFFPRQRRYLINQDIWDSLDRESKVAIILHEVVYREALAIGHENSINTRYLTARLLEADFADLSPAEYAALVSQAGFPVEETCEKLEYVTSFSIETSHATGLPSGGSRVRAVESVDLCYVAGSKVALSDGTAKYLLSQPFHLPFSIIEDSRTGYDLRFGVSYDYGDYSAFEEMTGTKIPGYLGVFEVGTECRAYRTDNRGRRMERGSCTSPIQ